MAETIAAKEYQDFMTLRETIKQGIEAADSEFMLITYKQILAVINKRQKAANNLNIQLENKQIRELTASKKESFAAKKSSEQ